LLPPAAAPPGLLGPARSDLGRLSGRADRRHPAPTPDHFLTTLHAPASLQVQYAIEAASAGLCLDWQHARVACRTRVIARHQQPARDQPEDDLGQDDHEEGEAEREHVHVDCVLPWWGACRAAARVMAGDASAAPRARRAACMAVKSTAPSAD